MDLAHPQTALVAFSAATLALVGAQLTARRRRPLPWALTSFLLRWIGVAIVAWVMGGPRSERLDRSPGLLFVAIDGSASVSRSEFESSCRAAAQLGIPKETFVFGERVRSLDAAATYPNDLRSDPTDAWTRMLLDRRADPRSSRWLVASDGRIELPRSLLRLPWAEAPGMIPMMAVDPRDRRIVSVHREGPTTTTDPLPLRAIVQSGAAGEIVLRIAVDGTISRELPVQLVPGENSIAISLPPLSAGPHRIVVSAALGDGAAATEFVNPAPARVLVAHAREPSIVLRVLEVQGFDVTSISANDLTPERLPGHSVLVFDRIDAATLSTPDMLRAIAAHLESGGGIFFLPSEQPGALYGLDAAPFLGFLPLLGKAPPPPPSVEPPSETPTDEALAPPNPDSRTEERRPAPSLGLILAIDSSRSMEGSRIRLAKEAALAAAEIVHPEDLVGILAFNQTAKVISELTPAADRVGIRSRIARIQPGGGTDFKPALELARELFAGEVLGIKHLILLTDGEGIPNPLSALVQSMVAEGITVSTVGCGHGADARVLSDLAAWGRGKFHPALSLDEVPQLFAVEVQRVIEAAGARKRSDKPAAPRPPTPAEPDAPSPSPTPPSEEAATPVVVALPAPYLSGVAIHECPGVFGFHGALARPGTWVALATESGDPILAHGLAGGGRVVASTTPFDGRFGAHLANWSGVQVLTAQIVRFAEPRGDPRRFAIEISGAGRLQLLRVFDADATDTPSQLDVRVTDDAGNAVGVSVRPSGPDAYTLEADPSESAPLLIASVRAAGGEDLAQRTIPLPPPPELVQRGLDLEGLAAWADAVGGVVLPSWPEHPRVPERVTRSVEPSELPWLPVLIALLLADLVLKRARPGERRRLQRAP